MIQNSVAIFQRQSPTPILVLKPAEKEILNKLVNSSTISKAIFLRAKIILCSTEQFSIYQIVKLLNITWKTAQKWIRRWKSFTSEFSKVQDKEADHALVKLIINCLSDASRNGRCPKFTPEQVMKIINLACTTPETLGIPLSHWSSRSLAQQAINMKIVPKICHERISFF
jgi:putative transposase